MCKGAANANAANNAATMVVVILMATSEERKKIPDFLRSLLCVHAASVAGSTHTHAHTHHPRAISMLAPCF